MINLAALDRAIERLRLSLSYAETELARQDPGWTDMCQSAVIQRFEHTFELAVKLLIRVLAEDTVEDVRRLAYRDLIRLAASRGFLKDPEAWFEYKRLRNITSHEYNETYATKVYEAAFRFYEDVAALRSALGRSRD